MTPTEPRPLAVIDIDGVLADVRHRLHFLQQQPKDWRGFFAAAPADPPLETGLETARRLAEVYDVVYLSGRPEHCRADTEEWFDRFGLPPGPLHLRPHHDHRPARFFKVEMLRRFAEQRTVAVLVDDDSRVVEAALEAGFDVLPATWMHEAPEEQAVLRDAQEDEGRT